MAKRFVTRQKNCYCHTCARDIHYLGINSHRAAHRRRFEDCKITYTYGDTYTFAFSECRPTQRATDGLESALFGESDEVVLSRGAERLVIRRR